jgi:hypothetical protein
MRIPSAESSSFSHTRSKMTQAVVSNSRRAYRCETWHNLSNSQSHTGHRRPCSSQGPCRQGRQRNPHRSAQYTLFPADLRSTPHLPHIAGTQASDNQCHRGLWSRRPGGRRSRYSRLGQAPDTSVRRGSHRHPCMESTVRRAGRWTEPASCRNSVRCPSTALRPLADRSRLLVQKHGRAGPRRRSPSRSCWCQHKKDSLPSAQEANEAHRASVATHSTY